MSKASCIAWQVDEFVAKQIRKAKTEAIIEFAERVKRCILERDDETINYIKKKMLEELK